MANIKNKLSQPLSTEFSPKDLVVDIKNGHLYYKSNLGVHKLIGDNLSTDTEDERGYFAAGIEVVGDVKISGSDSNEGGQLTLSPPKGGGYIWNVDNYQENFRLFTEGTETAVRMQISSSGQVGIGTTTPTSGALHVAKSEVDFVAYFHNTSLDVRSSDGIGIQCGANTNNTGSIRYIQMYDGDKTWQGAIQAGNGGEGDDEISNGITLTSLSDRRQKHDIKITKFNLNDLMNIEVVDFKWNKTGTQSTGFIAQQVETVFPQAVTKPNKNTEFYGMDHAGLSPLIVKAIQDQQIIIDSLKARLEILEDKK